MDNAEFIKCFLPENMLEYFNVVKVERSECKGDDGSTKPCINIYLEEKYVLLIDKELKEYESKGFCEPKIVKDFPIRGKPSFLYIKRRRWRHRATHKEVKNDLSFLAENSKITQEFSVFLKGSR